jgi:hypothetical protein
VRFNDLVRQVLEILPNATIHEDRDGQLVINTNQRHQRTGDGTTATGMLEDFDVSDKRGPVF